MLGKSRPLKKGRRLDRWPQNAGKVQRPRLTALGDNTSFDNVVGFFRLGSKNRPVLPPLNTEIFPCRQLGHTVPLFKY